MRILRRVLLFTLIAALALALLLLWMAGGVQRPRVFEAEIERTRRDRANGAVSSTTSSELRVVTWNVGWAYGFGSEGTGTPKSKEELELALDRIAKVLADHRVDVALLQEIDFDSTRSHRTDQAMRIAEGAGLPYVARAMSWKAEWVPFPYWPPSHHFGRMRSGGAVLSRFPLLANRVLLLPKPDHNPFWYNLFYLFRYLQEVRADVGGVPVRVFNTHIEAFDQENRELQARMLHDSLRMATGTHVIFGGDLNTVPPEARVRSAYPDEPATSHETDTTLAILRQIEHLAEAVPTDAYMERESAYFTFPSHAPNRRLDYLFVSPLVRVVEVRVLTDAGTASDHLPVLAVLRLE